MLTSTDLHIKNYRSTNTLERIYICLKCMVNEHVFMNLVSLYKVLVLIDFMTCKIVCVLGISTTRTNCDETM